MKEIPLTRGLVAFVDDEDYAELSKYKWYALASLHTYYAARNIPHGTRRQTALLMHKAILPGAPRVDHRDGDGLNNQRSNLRAATHKQNLQAKQHKKDGATSKFRGVCALRGKWTAQIRVDRRLKYLGVFSDELQAALAYDAAARLHFGEFASPNFI